MNKQIPRSLPYVAQAPWYIRILGLPAVGAILASLWPSPTPAMIEIWQQSPWPLRLVLMVGLIVVPRGAAGFLFIKTVFTETGIEHRTRLLRRVSKFYSEIESLVYESQTLGRPESIKMIFSDGSNISVTGGEGDIGLIIEMLKSHIGGNVIIKHR